MLRLIPKRLMLLFERPRGRPPPLFLSTLPTSPPLSPSSPSPNNKLFVGGLSWSVDEKTLKDAFSSFGEVTEDLLSHSLGRPSFLFLVCEVEDLEHLGDGDATMEDFLEAGGVEETLLEGHGRRSSTARPLLVGIGGAQDLGWRSSGHSVSPAYFDPSLS